MNKLKQNKVDQVRQNDSLKIEKMKRENRIGSIKVHTRAKSQVQVNSEASSPTNKTINQSIDSLQNKRYAPTQNSIRVTLPQIQYAKMSQINCELSENRSNEGKNEKVQVLAQRAKQFITRLRNQKRHIKGLFMIRKKQQEQRKKQQERTKRQSKQHLEALNQESKIAKMMIRILEHEQRINFRLNNNLERFKNVSHRSYTQDPEIINHQECPQKEKNNLSQSYQKVLSLKQKIKNLQLKIQSLYSV